MLDATPPPPTDAPVAPVYTYTTDAGEVVETLVRCANPACLRPFIPKSKVHRHCSAACREVFRIQTPARKVGNQRRSARSYERDGRAYRTLRRWLRVHGQLTPAVETALRALRGRRELTPNDARAILGFAPVVRAAPRARPDDAAPPRDASVPDPWALPSPAPRADGLLAQYLRLDLRPLPSPALSLRHTRLLHGALSYALGEAHRQGLAHWALRPVPMDESPFGWGVLFFDPAHAARLAGTAHTITLGDPAPGDTRRPRRGDAWRAPGARAPAVVERTLTFGASPVRVRPPAPRPAGRYRVTLDTLTPLCFSACKHRVFVRAPVPGTFVAALARVAAAAGVDVPEASIAVEAVAHDTAPVTVRAGGHLQRGTATRGLVRALEGALAVECNAVAAWLFECAARLGFGGLTAYGFGRVAVTVAPADPSSPLEPAPRTVRPVPVSYLRGTRVKESLG